MEGYVCDVRHAFREFILRLEQSMAGVPGFDAPQARATADCTVHHGRSSSCAGHGSTSSPLVPKIADFGLSRLYSGPSTNRSPDHVVEPPSAQTLQKTNTRNVTEFIRNTTRKDSTSKNSNIAGTSWSSVVCDTTEVSPTGRCLSPSTQSTILVRGPPDWYCRFYIRKVHSGSFQTYPNMGGPFKSLQEAENSIDRHLQSLLHATMRKESLDKLSPKDRLIRQSLYWSDGRSKAYSKAFVDENTLEGMCHLVQALVGKYNEDRNLSRDLAYELKDVRHYQTICEKHIWYYHFNFTAKTKGADDFNSGIDDLFFAEVTCMKGHELAVSSLCRIDTNANGLCYGCTNNGGVHMKHPNEANAYTAGHFDGYLPFGYDGEWDAWDGNVKAEEDRLSSLYEGLDDPEFLKEIFTLPPHATATFKED